MAFINKIKAGGHIVGKPEGSKNSYSMVNWVFMIFWHNVSDFANRDKWLPSGSRWQWFSHQHLRLRGGFLSHVWLPQLQLCRHPPPQKSPYFWCSSEFMGYNPILKHAQIHDPFVNFAEFKPKNPTFSPCLTLKPPRNRGTKPDISCAKIAVVHRWNLSRIDTYYMLHNALKCYKML